MAQNKFIVTLLLLVILTLSYTIFHTFKGVCVKDKGKLAIVDDDDGEIDKNIIFYSNSSLYTGQYDYSTSDSCSNGHIANMAPICGNDGCLKVRFIYNSCIINT